MRVLKTQIVIMKEVIWCLDQAEENRPLSVAERDLRRNLKTMYLGLLFPKDQVTAAVSPYWDANTKFFHARANGRRRKNFI